MENPVDIELFNLIIYTYVCFVKNSLHFKRYCIYYKSCVLYLVESMFGQFSFEDFVNESEILGPVFLLCYLFVIAIIFINLLVAILSHIFEWANRKATVYFYMEKIDRFIIHLYIYIYMFQDQKNGLRFGLWMLGHYSFDVFLFKYNIFDILFLLA